MPIYYVGPGGNNGNSGLTWALRKLTLNGAEDVPVVAGDIVIVGPGVYRETLLVDVAGGAGNPITYIGDVTGEVTDGVGGIVRITGSDNDQTTVRDRCIDCNGISRHYRTFRGFAIGLSTIDLMYLNNNTNWIIEDCVFHDSKFRHITIWNTGSLNHIVRRCLFLGSEANGEPIITINTGASGVQDINILIENCTFNGGWGRCIQTRRVGGVTYRNLLFYGGEYGIRMTTAPPVGFTPNHVENCIFAYTWHAIDCFVLGEITEDFNTFHENLVNRTNVAVGAASQTYPPLLLNPILNSGESQASGFKFPWWFGELSEWSQIRAITGTNEPTEELRGILRPVTASKNSWGPIQFYDMERETGTVRTGSVSMVLHDAARHQIFVPVTATSTTIQIYVYREANYAGNLPQMIIKQPGQADDITTDVGAAGGWNLLTTTLVPAALPPYVIVELVSRNTAAAGNYDTFFDDLDVS